MAGLYQLSPVELPADFSKLELSAYAFPLGGAFLHGPLRWLVKLSSSFLEAGLGFLSQWREAPYQQRAYLWQNYVLLQIIVQHLARQLGHFNPCCGTGQCQGWGCLHLLNLRGVSGYRHPLHQVADVRDQCLGLGWGLG